jgi:hypothetical protein
MKKSSITQKWSWANTHPHLQRCHIETWQDHHTKVTNQSHLFHTMFTNISCSLSVKHCIYEVELPVPQLRRLVAGFLSRGPGFEKGTSRVGSVVARASLGKVLLQVLRFPLPIIHTTDCFTIIIIIIIIIICYNTPISDLSNSGLVFTPSNKRR